MSSMPRLEKGIDLLRQRRVERGLAPQTAPLLSVRGVLLRGMALGAIPLAAVVVVMLLLGSRQAQVSLQLDGLQGIPVQLKGLENQATKLRQEFSSIQRSNEGLAKGLVAVSSGSALLAQMAAITPQGVQLTDLQVQGNSLSLKGVANDPQAFRRVNSLSLLLARSPLVEPVSVKVIKLTRDEPKDGVVGPVAWDLSASFASLPATQQLEVLNQLGALGMARRLQILERAGVLP